MKSIFCYLTLLASLNAVSQQQTAMANQNYANQTGKLGYFYAGATKSELAEGSPYLNENYLPSSISTVNGEAPPIRYNAYADEMEFVKGETRYNVIKSDSVVVKIFDKSYQYLEHQTSKGWEKGYLVVLTDPSKDKNTLYKKEKIVLVSETTTNGYNAAKPPRFLKEDDKYYLGDPDKIVAMPKKKELLKMFPNKTAALENYIKANKVSFSKEEDLIGLVTFMNTL